MGRLGFITLVLAIVYAGSTLTPWSVGMCGEESVVEAYSPDGSYLARVYVRNCGATTGYLTHVNLRPKWSYFNNTWVGTIVQDQVFDNACLSKINLLWKDNSNLEIQYDACPLTKDRKDHAFMKSETWRGINITYSEGHLAE